jgi:hypothetical protein
LRRLNYALNHWHRPSSLEAIHSYNSVRAEVIRAKQ